jgi:gluconokinase
LNCILAIDIGTTSSKALVVQADGRVVVSAQQGYPTMYPMPGFVEQNPQEILDAVKNIIRQCSSHRSVIKAVSFSSAMHSLVAVDASGAPLTNLIIWADARSAEQAKALRGSTRSDFIYATSGTPIHPMSPFCKFLWIKEHKPDLLKKAHKFISIKEFVVHQLSGQYVVDYSVASATGLFDIHQLNWSDEILNEIGISTKQLSDCVSPYHAISMRPDAASELGIDQDTVMVMGGSDGCLANLGSGAMNAGELSLTVGTSGAVRMASSRYSHDSRQRVFNYRLDEHTFITGGATNNGLVLLDWFQRMMGVKEWSLDTFVQSALKVESGSSGLLFLPYVFGERAPYYNPDMRGVFFGLAQHHSKEHMMRALVEGICFELKSITDSVEEVGGPVEKIFASGGFSRSDEWLQILANILNKNVELRDIHDASSLGAALIGFKALNLKTFFAVGADSKTFSPHPAFRATYDNLFGVFSRTTQALGAEFSSITAIQNTHRVD